MTNYTVVSENNDIYDWLYTKHRSDGRVDRMPSPRQLPRMGRYTSTETFSSNICG